MFCPIPNTIIYKGCPLYYELSGSGEPVVFIQGVGISGSGWRRQVEELSKRHLCLTFDNRGLGRSCPNSVSITVEQLGSDTLAIMDAAGIDHAHLVGHSLGGLVAQQVALSMPQRVKTLSLLCTTGRGADALRLSPALIALALRSRIGTRRAKRLAFLRIVMPLSYLANIDGDALAEQLASVFGHDLAETPAVVQKQLAALRRFNPGTRLNALKHIPTLVVSASDDPIFPPKFGRALAETIGGVQFIEMKDASHGVIIQCAEEVNKLLLDHFTRAATI